MQSERETDGAVVGKEERQAIVAWLRHQSDLGANRGNEAEKNTAKRAAFGGGALALKRAADAIEAGDHRTTRFIRNPIDPAQAATTPDTETTRLRAENARLREALEPVMHWYQSDEQDDRSTVDILHDVVADLQHDRTAALRALALRLAGSNLSICAETTGGTAGPDEGLMLAIRQWKEADVMFRAALAQEQQPGERAGYGEAAAIPFPSEAAANLGAWMSAALDDPKVCDAMKADVRDWFSAGMPTAPSQGQDLRQPTCALGFWRPVHKGCPECGPNGPCVDPAYERLIQWQAKPWWRRLFSSPPIY